MHKVALTMHVAHWEMKCWLSDAMSCHQGPSCHASCIILSEQQIDMVFIPKPLELQANSANHQQCIKLQAGWSSGACEIY